jgi:FK506-binding protein 6
VPENAVVTVHYGAYVEYDDEPYDSTWMRGCPLKCDLYRGFIPGLFVGIASMKKGEISRFLIHPDMGYGKMGCPPRIPQSK